METTVSLHVTVFIHAENPPPNILKEGEKKTNRKQKTKFDHWDPNLLSSYALRTNDAHPLNTGPSSSTYPIVYYNAYRTN